MWVFLVLGVNLIVVIMLILMFSMPSPIASGKVPTSEDRTILEQGQPALFKIVSLIPTTINGIIKIGDDPIVQLVVEVYPIDGARYTLKKDLLVPLLYLARLQPGSILPGKYDSQDTTKIAFEFTRILSKEEYIFAKSNLDVSFPIPSDTITDTD
jgi:hypothetical protein